MVCVRWNKIFVSALSSLALVVLSLVCMVQPASAITCDTAYSGDGSHADPWVVSTMNELSCFVSGIAPAPAGGGDAYIVQDADITWDNRSQLDPGGTEPFHYDGGGHSVTVESVADFQGLFFRTNFDEVKNLSISALNSSLSYGSGWFTDQDFNSVFTNVSSDGHISSGSGGIIGQAYGTTISRAYSTGDIGVFAGGIIGQNSENVTISNAYSTGTIMRDAGGIAGLGTLGIIVSSSYSLGDIGSFSGGIIGSYSDSPVVTNVFSAGAIQPSGGGIIGSYTSGGIITNSYSVSGPPLAESAEDNVLSNVLQGNGNFSFADARAYLAPLNAWAECALVNPVGFYLVAITPVNPCEVQPTPLPSPDPALASTSAPNNVEEVVILSLAGVAALVVGVSITAVRRRFSRFFG